MRRHDMTQKKQWQRQIQINGQWRSQIHLKGSIRERSERLVTIKTFDQNDKETWPELFWIFFRFFFELFLEFFLNFFWNFFGTLLELFCKCLGTFLVLLYQPYSWDTEYYSDNWEPEFMTVFVSWQLRMTLDSIRNSCDVSVTHRVYRR